MATINENISDEMLVSYADGELNEADRRVVEVAIAEDQLLRAKVERYEASANLLKSTLANSEQATPDHVLHRIKQIEERASRQENTEKGSWGLSSLLEYLQPRYAGPALATFTVGLILGPSLLPMLVGGGSSYPAPGSNITVRGTINDVIETQVVGNDLIENLNIRLIQDGIGIQSGDSVSSSTPFSIIFLSPINGTATLSMLNADQTLIGLETIEVSVGRYANFEENELPSGRILSLRLSLAGENISLSYDLTYSTDD